MNIIDNKDNKDNKKTYRAIILILASNNNNIYNNCREIWKKYMNLNKNIGIFFVYGKLFKPLENYDSETDFIFDDIPESYPVYIHKSIKAFEILNLKYNYDYLIRTNLTTFWDLNKLEMNLENLPKEKCYYGDGPLPTYDHRGYYVSGTDTIVSRDLINKILENKEKIDYTIVEDASMGLFFHKYLKTPIISSNMCFYEDIQNYKSEYEKINDRFLKATKNNIDHYRVKNKINREYNDLFIYIYLLKKIYNIDHKI